MKLETENVKNNGYS